MAQAYAEQLERIFPTGSCCAMLRDRCGARWTEFTHHSFVQQLQHGTLPHAAYKSFLVQDYLFLKQLARVWMVAGTKAETLEELEVAASNALGTVQMEAKKLHVQQCAQWGINTQSLEQAEEALENVAYTRFVLDCGLTGDMLMLLVALAPCALGYAEIGLRLKHSEATSDEYNEWVQLYSGEDFLRSGEKVMEMIESQKHKLVGPQIDGTERMHTLQQVFNKATALEANFWTMALRLGQQATV